MIGALAGSAQFQDLVMQDLGLSGQSLYQGAYICWSGAMTTRDVRIGSFNVGSGGWLITGFVPYALQSGDEYEVHTMLPPREKGLALDVVIDRLWARQEYPIWAVDDLTVYTLPAAVKSVLGARFFSTPTDSLGKGVGHFTHWEAVTTATGEELRISPSLPASYQIIIDAEVALSLGAADVATVNIPDRELILDGAAAWCYELLAARAPGQETARYRAEAQRFSRKWALGLGRYQPQVDRKVQLESKF